MKITRLTTHCLRSPLAQAFAFSQGWVGERTCTLVEIETDAGISGWGEAFNQGLEPPQIAAATIDHALAPLLLGCDPEQIEVLWFKMYNHCRDFGRKGSVMAAISAVDMALWDITGKALERPVHQLLGGPFRSQVQPYATGFYRIKGQGEAARLADEARQHLANGFSLMKIKLGFGLHDDLAVMQAVGDALAETRAPHGHGPVELMVDSNHGYGFSDALQLGLALAPYKLRWYEEPVAPEDLHAYARLRERLPMPIAGGENEHGLYGFRDLIGQGCVDIAQPDIGSCGGITAARHIAALAQASGVAVNPHVWGSAVAQAASLQVIAALPVPHHGLFAREPILEYDLSDHPFRRELVAEPISIRDGMVAIPLAPGLGIEVNRDVVKHYAMP